MLAPYWGTGCCCAAWGAPKAPCTTERDLSTPLSPCLTAMMFTGATEALLKGHPHFKVPTVTGTNTVCLPDKSPYYALARATLPNTRVNLSGHVIMQGCPSERMRALTWLLAAGRGADVLGAGLALLP